MNEYDITKLLDKQGRLVSLPKKQIPRQAALSWLTNSFDHGCFYSEKEVNAMLVNRSTAGDCALLRRELCDSGLLSRTNNGSRYWRSDFLHGEINCGGAMLRNLHNSDTETLIGIHESLRYYDDITGEAYTTEDAQALIRKTNLPPEGSPEFYLAKMILTSDNQPIGYIMLYEGYPQPDTLWVGSLFFHREYHHKGFGRKVMQTVETQAGLSGFDHVGLGAFSQNISGLQFWVGQGYCKIDKIRVNEKQRAILGLSKRLQGGIAGTTRKA